MSKKFTELPDAQVGTESDLYVVVQAVQNRKQTRTQLRTAIIAGWQTFIGTFLNAASAADARSAIGAQEELSLGAPIEDFLATPSSANLRAALTDETGTGAAVFGTAPTIAQPNVVGVTNGGDAAAGSVGEFISATRPTGTPLSLVSGTAVNVTSITLTAGDWDVSGNMGLLPAGTTTTSGLGVAISTTSATFPTTPGEGGYNYLNFATPAGAANIMATGRRRISIASTTTVYLVGAATFAVSTNAAYGFIGARRVR